ncbi:MAG TPA: glycine oxidase ThiO [Polyangiaceae bacterium]|nr:glycine oxidase ThiO [Polyangiaceae bacterium]
MKRTSKPSARNTTRAIKKRNLPKPPSALAPRTAAGHATSFDVIVIGGGIMGTGASFELAKRGARVLVLERSVPGAEASSAAAGILGAQAEAHHDSDWFELSLKSRQRHAEWAKELLERTGIDVEYRLCGVVRASATLEAAQAMQAERAFQRRYGCRVSDLDARSLSRLLPQFSSKLQGGVYFPEDARVDPPKLLRALRIAAEKAGAVFRSGTYVRRVLRDTKRATGVALDDGTELKAKHVVVAAGSWTSLVEGVPTTRIVKPARGQIVELSAPAPLFEPVVFGPGCYLVPRDDGRVLIGSTLEFVGYRREVTAQAVRNLLDAALTLVPALADATLSGTWSNFRPYTSDETPWVGEGEVPGLVLATGHYRNGILLAPITADLVTAAIVGDSGKRRPRAARPADTE